MLRVASTVYRKCYDIPHDKDLKPALKCNAFIITATLLFYFWFQYW